MLRLVVLSVTFGLIGCSHVERPPAGTRTTPGAPVATDAGGATAPPPAPEKSPFAAAALFGPKVGTRLYASGKRLVVFQAQPTEPYPWTLISPRAGGGWNELTGPMKKYIADNKAELLEVAGVGVDETWIGTSYVDPHAPAQAFVMRTWHGKGGPLQPVAGPVYRFIGELRKGQSVGLPYGGPPGPMFDDPAEPLRNVAGKGPLPTLPRRLSLTRAAFSGTGGACALGGQHTKEGFGQVLWTLGPQGQKTHPLDFDYPKQEAALFYTGGECLIVAHDDEDGTAFLRVRGGELRSVHIAYKYAVASVAEGGGIWLSDGAGVVRVSLGDTEAKAEPVPLPRIAACTKPLEVAGLVAFRDDDVWIDASCPQSPEPWHGLLHTQAAPQRLETLPDP